MSLSLSFRSGPVLEADTLVAFIYADNRLSHAAQDLEEEGNGTLTKALSGLGSFKGKQGQTLIVSAPASVPYSRILLVGAGDPQALEPHEAEVLGGKIVAALANTGARKVTVHSDLSPALSAHVAFGMKLRAYRFDKYKSKKDGDDQPARIEAVEFLLDLPSEAEKAALPLQAAADGVLMARDLVNEPPNELYPESFAERIRDELRPLGVDVDILDEKKMQRLGFAAHLAVGMGSARPPRVVVMRWNGAKKGSDARPVALVGKGVTFDTGGISIKPAANMDEMKMDMGGAAAVVGAMRAIAARKADANVVGIVGLAENMPSDRSYRPGDIIQSHAGKTIEVLNTDAEGRLVLCDALSYVQKTYDPAVIVDLATLTGAMMVALGYEYAGAFANQDALWTQLNEAGKATGEKLWRMPLDEAYRKEMESTVADLRNLGSLGRFGGGCSAAGFLEHFIDKDRAWAHLDIAGTAWIAADRPLIPKHATGFGVRVLDRLIADNYEG